MRAIAFSLVFLSQFCLAQGDTDSILRYRASVRTSSDEASHVNTVVPAYISSGSDAALETLQCPIPRSDRVRNYTGIQCVWSSIETLGRWCGEKRLISPPITGRPQCKSYAGPASAAEVLGRLGVRFKQSYGDKKKGLEIIREAMSEGRGALFDVPGHAMVVVHFSEEEDRVCWIDNSDDSLKAQTSTVDRFMKRWGSWVLVVYSDPDIVPYKSYRFSIPVVEVGEPFHGRSINFVPFPH